MSPVTGLTLSSLQVSSEPMERKLRRMDRDVSGLEFCIVLPFMPFPKLIPRTPMEAAGSREGNARGLLRAIASSLNTPSPSVLERSEDSMRGDKKAMLSLEVEDLVDMLSGDDLPLCEGVIMVLGRLREGGLREILLVATNVPVDPTAAL